MRLFPRLRVLDAALAAYVVAVLVGTLIPFRFQTPQLSRSDPVWSPPDGMILDGAGMFSFRRENPAIGEAIARQKAFFLYVEVYPEHQRQNGPARICSYGIDKTYQGFMLGQAGRSIELHLARPTSRRGDRAPQRFMFRRALAAGEWNSILAIVDSSAISIHRNGRLLGRKATRALDPPQWSRQCRLVAGNEAFGDRPWFGRIRRLVIGSGPPPPFVLAEAGVDAVGLIAPGDSGAGGQILFDLAGADNRYPEGWRPHRTDVYGRAVATGLSLIPFAEPGNRAWARLDWIQNLLLMAPLGMLLAWRGRSWPVILLISLLFSLAIEVTQLWLPSRHTQATDVVLNAVGAVGAGLAVRPLRHKRA